MNNRDSALEAYYEALDRGYSPELEQIIIDCKNSFYIYEFAHNVRGANIPKLEQAIIDSGNPRLAYSFAFIEGANILKLEQAVIDSEDPRWAYFFARHVKGANISDLVDFVLINDLAGLKNLFKARPDLKRKYEMGK